MTRRFTLVAVALAALTSVAAQPLHAQTTAPAVPANPYKILTVSRESVKPGKASAHDKIESAWARSLLAAKIPISALALQSLTGPRETWWVSAFSSFDEYTRLNAAYAANAALSAIDTRMSAQDADMLSDARSMVLRAREELSYGAAPEIAQMRFFTISRVSIRPGHVMEFEDARKTIKAAHETAHATDSYMVYEALAGAPSGTFFVMVPRKSLAELDDDAKIHGAEYMTALGGDEGRKKLSAMVADYMNNSQTDYYAFVPSQSIVSKRWAKADSSYWTLQRPNPTP